MKRRFQIIGASFGWFALAAQFVLSISARQTSLLEATIRYFSYFTILTNILLSLYFTASIFHGRQEWLRRFRSDDSATAITAFISVVGIVYHIVLSNLWQPSGMQLLVDQLLHTVMPLFMFLYWIFAISGQNLHLKYILPWLAYPIIYLLLVLARGDIANFYPYPFLDIAQIGLKNVLVNIAYISVGTLIILILFMARKLTRLFQHRRRQ